MFCETCTDQTTLLLTNRHDAGWLKGPSVAALLMLSASDKEHTETTQTSDKHLTACCGSFKKQLTEQ